MHDAHRTVTEWAQRARTHCRWEQPFHTTFDPSTPAGQWFLGGRLNVSVNCLDRHLPERADVPAIHWEAEPLEERRTITYSQLHAEVVAFTRALRSLGIGPGDRVALYMSWLPETVVAMLACARIGAVHALLPVLLPADALTDRLVDLEPKLLVTQDGAWRRGVVLPLKSQSDEALAAATTIEHTIIVRRTGIDIDKFEGDWWYEDLIAPHRAPVSGLDEGGRPEPVVSDHPLAIMYIASRRRRPTGIVHRSAGFLVYAAVMHRHGFASQPEDVLWCAVEFSWSVGQTHAIYGPLACGATTVMYEGTLDTPNHGRAWDIIERYQVDTLLTTPSIVRNIRSWVDSPPGDRVGSVRRVVTGGERLDPETREWLSKEIGHGQASIATAWGQTELGGVVRVRPWLDEGLPDPGLEVIDEQGKPAPTNVDGELTLLHPWPAVFLGHHHPGGRTEFDSERGSAACFRTGDVAHRDVADDGLITIVGRKDPVISVAAQLVSVTEVVDVLIEHPFVVDAELIDRPDRRRGRVVVACVVLEPGIDPSSAIATELRSHVHDTLGGLAAPRAFAFCEELPTDVPRAALRGALETLCARTTSPSLSLSTAQIRGAVAATLLKVP
ncbi:MAG: AMP-binding protein [Egibacteraceae bacterium]